MACEFVRDLGLSFPTETSKRKSRYYSVICPYCKKEFKVIAQYYNSGKLKSCKKCASGIRDLSVYYRKHGLRKDPLYTTWACVKDRCNNDRHKSYKNYGGRGITMCDEWSNDFKKFYDWSIKNGYEKGLDIDRIDNDGNYEPDNCRYVSRFINMSNTRSIRSDNKSGFRGVSIRKSNSRARAMITIDGKPRYLGTFDTPEQASEVYEAARKKKYSNI